jgi:hypothetical protein
MPSSSTDNCARVSETVPSVACGQMNRRFSRRLTNRHRPSPSNQSSFTMPLPPRKTKSGRRTAVAPERSSTCALRPSKPRRMSVTPAASHIFVPVRSSDHLRKLSRITRNSVESARRSMLSSTRPGKLRVDRTRCGIIDARWWLRLLFSRYRHRYQTATLGSTRHRVARPGATQTPGLRSRPAPSPPTSRSRPVVRSALRFDASRQLTAS